MKKNIIALVMAFIFSFTFYAPANAAISEKECEFINTEIICFVDSILMKDYNGLLFQTAKLDNKSLKKAMEDFKKEGVFNWSRDNLEDVYVIQSVFKLWKCLFSVAVKNAIEDGADYEIIFRLQQAKYNFTIYERELTRMLK